MYSESNEDELGVVDRAFVLSSRGLGFLAGLSIPLVAMKGLSYLVTNGFTDSSFLREPISWGISVIGTIGINYALYSTHAPTLPALGFLIGEDIASKIIGRRNY